MKTCPYCETKLIADKEHKNVYICPSKGHHYGDDNGFLDFTIWKNNIHIAFYNLKYKEYGLPLNNEQPYIEDFSILKGKSFVELCDLYDKLIIFK